MVFIGRIFAISTIAVIYMVSDVAAGPGAAALIEVGKKYGAPFAETASQRLHGNVFGKGRATRSTDVIVFNKSNKSFKLDTHYCDHGGYSTDLFPEYELGPKQSTVFGMESHGFATGVECKTRYASSDGSFFEMTSVNPYIGSNSILDLCSYSLTMIPTLGQGDNNQVRFIVENA